MKIEGETLGIVVSIVIVVAIIIIFLPKIFAFLSNPFSPAADYLNSLGIYSSDPFDRIYGFIELATVCFCISIIVILISGGWEVLGLIGIVFMLAAIGSLLMAAWIAITTYIIPMLPKLLPKLLELKLLLGAGGIWSANIFPVPLKLLL
jgi:hypothetical protein